MSYRKFTVVILLVISLLFPGLALAQDELSVSVLYTETCGEAKLEIDVQGGTEPFDILVAYGDGEEDEIMAVSAFPLVVFHTYPSPGDFEYAVKVYNNSGMDGEAEGTLTIAGPEVTLESDPSPPLLPLVPGGTTVDFTVLVSGGEPPYIFEWDLDADGSSDDVADPTSGTASFIYTEPGKVKASVRATDACGFTERDKLTVIIVDSSGEDEEEGGDGLNQEGEPDVQEGCHPVAQRISDTLNTFIPDRIDGEYSCEEIFNFFQGEEGGEGHRFGLLQHAYQMTQIIDELTWEDILDWHLAGSGWGVLQQLNRFSEALEEVRITDLFRRVMSGVNTVGDIRSALKTALRYEADFEDALGRLESGSSPGELSQLYRTAMEMEIDPAKLDEYLESGISLSQVRHASKVADQTGGEWQLILEAYSSGSGWGELRKAIRLEDEVTDFETILEIGVDAYREQQREEKRTEKKAEKEGRTVKRLTDQYGIDESEVWSIINDSCQGDWECARDHLREKDREDREDRDLERNQRTVEQLVEKYGVSEDKVWGVFNGACGSNWGCVRAYFRDQAKEGSGKGKN